MGNKKVWVEFWVQDRAANMETRQTGNDVIKPEMTSSETGNDDRHHNAMEKTRLLKVLYKIHQQFDVVHVYVIELGCLGLTEIFV